MLENNINDAKENKTEETTNNSKDNGSGYCICCRNVTTKQKLIMLSIVSIIFSVIVVVILAPTIKSSLTPLFEWFNPRKWDVLPLIILFYGSWEILTIPGAETWTFFIGFLYGMLYGWPIVYFTSLTSSCIAFIISRYCLKKYIFQKMCASGCCNCRRTNDDDIEEFDKWFNFLVKNHDFLAVLAIRFFFIPPGTWTNHLFAHTECTFISFFGATAIGKIFVSFIGSYLGSQLKNIFELTSSNNQDPTFTYLIPAFFFVVFLGIAIIIGLKSKKWLNKQREIFENQQHIVSNNSDDENESNKELIELMANEQKL